MIMAEPLAPQDLLAETLTQAQDMANREEAGSASVGPPSLGDVHVFEHTQDFPVEWVFVARDPATPELLLMIPADGNFLVGSCDLAMPDDSSVGALKLRCRFGVWVATERLEGRPPVGSVGEKVAGRARQKWLDVGQGDTIGSVLEREVDDDPEYREWVEEVLVPARQALVESSPEAATGPLAEVVDLDARRDHERRLIQTRRLALAVAASLLIAVLGLSVQLHQMQSQVLEPFLLDTLNLPEVKFRDVGRTGDVVPVTSKKGLWTLHLVLPENGSNPAPYRFHLVPAGATTVIWSKEHGPAREVILGIPQHSIDPGTYHLDLHRVDETGKIELLTTINLRFELDSD